MELCKKGHKTILASRYLTSFDPDSEPFDDGIEEDCGYGEIPAEVSVGIHWCPECDEIVDAWIEESYQETWRRLQDAERLIARAVEIMTPEQVGQWDGVRAWQEGIAEQTLASNHKDAEEN